MTSSTSSEQETLCVKYHQQGDGSMMVVAWHRLIFCRMETSITRRSTKRKKPIFCRQWTCVWSYDSALCNEDVSQYSLSHVMMRFVRQKKWTVLAFIFSNQTAKSMAALVKNSRTRSQTKHDTSMNKHYPRNRNSTTGIVLRKCESSRRMPPLCAIGLVLYLALASLRGTLHKKPANKILCF